MFILCLILWILLNGRVTVEIILFGLVISAICCFLSGKLFGFRLKNEKKLLRLVPGVLTLGGILLREVWKANLAVIRMIYSRKTPEPEFVTFDAPLATTGAGIALADCITLTPGTISGEFEAGKYTVHCLDKSMAEGLADSCFVQQLKKIEEAGVEK